MVVSLYFGVLALLIVTGGHLDASPDPSSDQISALEEQWSEFKIKFNKTYPNKLEHDQRKLIFSETLARIQQHNAKYQKYDQNDHLSNPNATYFKLGLNEFSDWSREEFASRLFGRVKPVFRPQQPTEPIHLNLTEYPAELDLRKHGYVTPVKDQNYPRRPENPRGCGSCWAFSVTGALEGQIYKKTGKLISLSEQQLVDCSRSNNGCRGGDQLLAFDYVMKNGISTEESYPYENQEDKCRYDPKNKVGATVIDTHSLVGEDRFIHALVKVGPISVDFQASDEMFGKYKNGVFQLDPDCKGNSSEINHAMLLVGYGVENGQKYWLVKNSWGTKWGESGYGKVLRGENFCFIENQGSYPVLG